MTEELTITKQALIAVEKEKKDIEAVLERDKVLWEQKAIFLEKNKEDMKEEYM